MFKYSKKEARDGSYTKEFRLKIYIYVLRNHYRDLRGAIRYDFKTSFLEKRLEGGKKSSAEPT